LRTAGGYAAAGSSRRPESEAMQPCTSQSRSARSAAIRTRTRAVKERAEFPRQKLCVREDRNFSLPCEPRVLNRERFFYANVEGQGSRVDLDLRRISAFVPSASVRTRNFGATMLCVKFRLTQPPCKDVSHLGQHRTDRTRSHQSDVVCRRQGLGKVQLVKGRYRPGRQALHAGRRH